MGIRATAGFMESLRRLSSRSRRVKDAADLLLRRAGLKQRYNVVRMDTLDPTWHDEDEILLHAAFRVLTFLVEEDQAMRYVQHFPEPDPNAPPGGVGDAEWADEYSARSREMFDLYGWWRYERPKRRDPLEDYRGPVPGFVPDSSGTPPGSERYILEDSDEPRFAAWRAVCEEHRRLERAWWEEDQRNLHRLVDIRGHLWA